MVQMAVGLAQVVIHFCVVDLIIVLCGFKLTINLGNHHGRGMLLKRGRRDVCLRFNGANLLDLYQLARNWRQA